MLEAIAAIERRLHRGKAAFEKDVLLHGEFEVDTEIVWEAARRDVPAIEPRIERLLERLEGRLQPRFRPMPPGRAAWRRSTPQSPAPCRT